MHIKVRSGLLRDSLNRVLTIVDRKNSRPILTYTLVKVANGGIEIIATDLEVSAKIIVAANVLKPGSFCINAKNLYDIVRELPELELELEVAQDTNLLKLSSQDIKYSLLICGSDEFPAINFQSSEKDFEIQSKDLIEIFQKTTHAISIDETKQYLNGIFLQVIDSKLRAVATDSYRLALLENENLESMSPSLVNGIIIPKKGVAELKRLAESYVDQKLRIAVDDSFVYLSVNGEFYLTVRLIAREYPKYQAVIPSKTTYSMTVDKDTLLNAVKRVRLLANEKSHGIRFSLRQDSLVISANHPSLGDAVERLPVSYTGKDIEIGVNARYLIDTFSIFDASEISFEFNNEFSPLVLKSSALPKFLGVIMPLKL